MKLFRLKNSHIKEMMTSVNWTGHCLYDIAHVKKIMFLQFSN